jgi:hypothetical protein
MQETSEEGMGAWVCAKGGAAVPWGCLYRRGRGGEAAPDGHGHQWPCGVDGQSRGGGEVKERKQPTDGGRVMAEHHCGLKKYFEGGGVRNSASNGRRP